MHMKKAIYRMQVIFEVEVLRHTSIEINRLLGFILLLLGFNSLVRAYLSIAGETGLCLYRK
jgi:hypothetical protein